MNSVDQTLRKAREVEEKFKIFMEKKAQQDKSIEETLKRIDKTQQTIKQTKQTINNVDQLYTKLEKLFGDTIDQAVLAIEKSTLVTVAEPGFEPHRVDAQKVGSMLKDKKKIIFLTGAGISAASGIPTFRGDNGFWSKEKVQIDQNSKAQQIDPQIILTNQFFSLHPEKTWKWLKNFLQLKVKSKPNKGHVALSEIIQNLRGRGKQVYLVTQNIDNFHMQVKNQRIAKNKNIKDYPIYEIHGNILKVRCDHCSIQDKQLYEEPFQSYLDILQMKSKLYCPRCQGPLRPHIMFFDEFYSEVFHHSETIANFLAEADAVVVIGTSLSTGLANTIVQNSLENKRQIVEINANCEIRKNAAWWMQDKAEKILEELKVELIKK